MAGSFSEFLRLSLKEIEAAGLMRSLRSVESPQGPVLQIAGRQIVNFSSNDYLGFANHPALHAAAARAMAQYGCGAGASRLICGNSTCHEELESCLAHFKRTESALAFSSGYAAAMGTIPALCGRGDILILDKLCHACLVDAARLSGATLRVFPHNDMNCLERHLRWARERAPAARVMVLAESVYSMDGDTAPLAEMVELKERFDAWLFLDEAHGIGVIGDHGRGLAEAMGLAHRIEVQMGTLGKALGSHGAYVAGRANLREFLINRARSFIYSTAPPPAIAAAACEAVKVLSDAEGQDRLGRLWRNIELLRSSLGIAQAPSAIFSLEIGGEAEAMEKASNLMAAGFFAPAIRFPTVSRGKARLRVTLTALHTADQIKGLAAACAG